MRVKLVERTLKELLCQLLKYRVKREKRLFIIIFWMEDICYLQSCENFLKEKR